MHYYISNEPVLISLLKGKELFLIVSVVHQLEYASVLFMVLFFKSQTCTSSWRVIPCNGEAPWSSKSELAVKWI